MENKLFQEIKDKLAEYIKDSEFEGKVFVVGGCVRDMILEHEIKDIDIAVNIPDGGIKLANYLSIQNKLYIHPVTYPSYGTAMFRLKDFPEIELEAVQTRKEKYTDSRNRNPETVFGSLEEDCLRRDLTINSLYQNITDNSIIDFTKKGLDDIENQIIRTPCDPNVTYDDDPLRILRTCRFSSRYKWRIDKPTYDAMKTNVHRLGIITKERIQTELTHMFSSPNAAYAINMLKDIGAFYIIAPELQLFSEDNYIWEKTIRIVRNISSICKPELTWAALLCNHCVITDGVVDNYMTAGVNPSKAEELLKTLKYSNSFISHVCKIIKYHTMHPFGDLIKTMTLDMPFVDFEYHNNIRFEINHKALRCFQYTIKDKEMFRDIMTLAEARWYETPVGQFCNPFPGILNYVDNNHDFFNYKLPVTGNDLIEECGMQPGEEIKKMLINMLGIAFDRPEVTREELLDIVKNYLSTKD